MKTVLNWILSHQPAAAVSKMLTHWNRCVSGDRVLRREKQPRDKVKSLPSLIRREGVLEARVATTGAAHYLPLSVEPSARRLLGGVEAWMYLAKRSRSSGSQSVRLDHLQ